MYWKYFELIPDGDLLINNNKHLLETGVYEEIKLDNVEMNLNSINSLYFVYEQNLSLQWAYRSNGDLYLAQGPLFLAGVTDQLSLF